MPDYHVAINPPTNPGEENEGSITVDIVKLRGTKKRKTKDWRNYLRVRCGTNDVHEMNRITRALGFDELIP